MKVLAMEIERFCVPELLFNPSDIGILQAGVAEATWQSLQNLSLVNRFYCYYDRICLLIVNK